MLTEADITDTTAPDDLIAGIINADRHEPDMDAEPAPPPVLARRILDALCGTDDEPGPLDRYEIMAIDDSGHPVVVWYCPRTHVDTDRPGHVHVIFHGLNGDQSGLTLGEVLSSVLTHEREEHSGEDGEG